MTKEEKEAIEYFKDKEIKMKVTIPNILKLLENDKVLFDKFKSNKKFSNIIVSAINDNPYVYNEIYLLNTHISQYKEGNIFNHDEDRTRKLLLHKKEILKLRDKLEIDGYTIIPLKIYFVKNKAKVLLGLAKGKKNYNKKETIKERDIQREMEKSFKYR